MPNPVGYNRTYVWLEAPLTYDGWFRALRRGRSFATNGPLVLLSAGQAKVSDNVTPAAGGTVQVRLDVASAAPLDRAEVIYNGEIVAGVSTAPDQKAMRLDQEIRCESGGWIAGRAFGRCQGNVRFAQTSPIYIAGDRPPAQQPSDARRFASWISYLIDKAQSPGRFREAAHQAETVQLYREALSIYEALAARRA